MAHKITLGIIGGGQLAQMLVQNNPFHDLKIVIFSDHAECPAAHTQAEIVVGSLKDSKSVNNFFEKIQILTIENEFVNAELLGEMKDIFERVLFFPSIHSIQITQNKLSQKFLFQKLKLPTADFIEVESLAKTFEKFPKGFMLKKAFGGYDGKGNFKVESKNNFVSAEKFIAEALTEGSTVYAEELIAFQKELAQIYVQSLNKDFISYPLVISEQERNVCKLVYGPATEFEIANDLENQTNAIGKAIAKELSFVGAFAIEYFLTRDGRILINEMAPRVHNSGHYTLDASPQNQFENHLRAILGTSLKGPTTYPFFAMRNILGVENITKDIPPGAEKKITTSEDFKVYWYHKIKTAPYRKLGHINSIAITKQDLLRKIELMKKTEEDFWRKI